MKQHPARKWIAASCGIAAFWVLFSTGRTAWASEDTGGGEADEGIERSALRDPFWPVGYVPPTAEESAAQVSGGVDQDLPWPALPVQGRSRAPDGTCRVLIEGRGVVGENQIVSVHDKGYWFHWRIVHIDERGVQSIRMGVSQNRTPTGAELKTFVATSESRKEKTP